MIRIKFFLRLFSIFTITASQQMHAQVNLLAQDTVVNSRIEAKLSDLIAERNIQPYLTYFKKAETLSWQVSATTNYQGQSPPGLLIYISPQDSGEIYEMWKSLITEKNLVWIAADHSGNSFSAQRRVLQALLAIQLAKNRYQIDKQRIYLTGFSGGGRVASMMAPLYPETFTGGVFMGGANFWGTKLPEKISLMGKNRYVFINGESDFNLRESRGVSEKFKKAGLVNVEFIEVPNLGHKPPDASWLGAAIDYLDAH